MTYAPVRRLLLAVILVAAGAQNVRADIAEDAHDEGAERYDGAEFNMSSFVDTSFDKQTYRDTPGEARKPRQLERAGVVGELVKRRRGERGVKASEGGDRKLDTRNIGESLGEASGPVHELPGDWVPDKIDLAANGGFGVIPDNGSPVPYRLNGHVDIQRGRPWEEH